MDYTKKPYNMVKIKKNSALFNRIIDTTVMCPIKEPEYSIQGLLEDLGANYCQYSTGNKLNEHNYDKMEEDYDSNDGEENCDDSNEDTTEENYDDSNEDTTEENCDDTMENNEDNSEENNSNDDSEENSYSNDDSNNSNENAFTKEINKNIIKLIFPFNIAGKDRISELELKFERRNDIVSFFLSYDFNLTISNAELINKEYNDTNTIYTFQFSSLDYALEWVRFKTANVEFKSRNGNLAEIRAEMNDLMQSYEAGESSNKRKKVKKIDEDGFTYYE